MAGVMHAVYVAVTIFGLLVLFQIVKYIISIASHVSRINNIRNNRLNAYYPNQYTNNQSLGGSNNNQSSRGSNNNQISEEFLEPLPLYLPPVNSSQDQGQISNSEISPIDIQIHNEPIDRPPTYRK